MATASPKTPDDETRAASTREDASLFLDQDLSVLAFQRRVLDEAFDETNPLLERVKFLGILGANLDEFTMVREAELARDAERDVLPFEAAAAPAGSRLDRIRAELTSLRQDARQCLHGRLVPALAAEGLHLVSHADLRPEELEEIERYFTASILPLLMPLGFDAIRPFPHIPNRGTTLAVMLRDRSGLDRFACVRIPDTIPPLVSFPWRRRVRDGAVLERGFVWLDEVVAAGLEALFSGMQILSAHAFRVVRDAALHIPDGPAASLPDVIQDGVHRRQFGEIVALLIDDQAPPRLAELLADNLRVHPRAVHGTHALRDLSRLLEVSQLDRPDLQNRRFVPAVQPAFAAAATVFEAIDSGDRLLHHPFESFESMIQIFEQAARDPDVQSISMTMYRLDPHSRIVKALLDARKAGKPVRVVVELRARFDEQNNVAAARALERAGAHVVYGASGLKVHAKVALFVRRHGDGVRRYVHISSGNYSETNARVYTDVSLLTRDESIGADVTDLFNMLTGHGDAVAYRKLLVAPTALRARVADLISAEVESHRRYGGGRLILKVNALQDPDIIRRLYDASQAGVEIDLIVRGICCLRPGVAGLSERISVRSIVGRFLEHSRFWYFRNAGQERVYIGSPDLMTRNLDERVEVVVPIEDESLKRRIRDGILAVYLADNVKARILSSEGRYLRVHRDHGEPLVSSQEALFRPEVEGTAPGTPRPPAVETMPMPGLVAPGLPAVPIDEAKKERKKKEKARAAWISFVGRIVAQVVGAVATIVLGIYAVGKYGGGGQDSSSEALRPSAPVRPVRAAGAEAAIAVLPLDNFSGDATQDYFADGMTEALIARLAQVRGLRVISRTSSMQYKDRKDSLPAIAAELGVDLIVEGSVSRSGDRVRVTAQLIDAKRDEHIWSRTYDQTLRDVFALQAEVATAIVDEVRGVVPAAAGSSAARRTIDPAVYDLYLRGRHAWNRRTPDGFKEAISQFEQALAKDPGFALAYAGLADAYQLLGTTEASAAHDTVVKGKAAALRALALDDDLAEAHTSLAAFLHRNESDLQGADREFRRALELNPGYATAHQWYAILLAEEGRDEEARQHGQRAVALDPLFGTMHMTMGLVHYYGRRFDHAIQELQRALELAPHLSLARQLRARALVARGSYREVIEIYGADLGRLTPDELVALALAYQRSGDPARAKRVVDVLLAQKPAPTLALARWYAGIGDHNRALAMLTQLSERTSFPRSLERDPAFDRLRADPRFARLQAEAAAERRGASVSERSPGGRAASPP